MTSLPRWLRPAVLALLLFAVGSLLWYVGRGAGERAAGKRDLPGWIFIVAWALIYSCVAILFFDRASAASPEGGVAMRASLVAYVLLGFLWIGVGGEGAGISAALIGLMLVALAVAAAALAAQSKTGSLALLAPPLLWTSLALGLVA